MGSFRAPAAFSLKVEIAFLSFKYKTQKQMPVALIVKHHQKTESKSPHAIPVSMKEPLSAQSNM